MGHLHSNIYYNYIKKTEFCIRVHPILKYRVEMCVEKFGDKPRFIGYIPPELLSGALCELDEGEWNLRLIRWALEPLTNIPASEHVLKQLNNEQFLIYNRKMPTIPLFLLHTSGQVVGSVSLIEKKD